MSAKTLTPSLYMDLSDDLRVKTDRWLDQVYPGWRKAKITEATYDPDTREVKLTKLANGWGAARSLDDLQHETVVVEHHGDPPPGLIYWGG